MIFKRADSIGIRPQSVEEPGVMHAQNTGLFEIEGRKEGKSEESKKEI